MIRRNRQTVSGSSRGFLAAFTEWNRNDVYAYFKVSKFVSKPDFQGPSYLSKCCQQNRDASFFPDVRLLYPYFVLICKYSLTFPVTDNIQYLAKRENNCLLYKYSNAKTGNQNESLVMRNTGKGDQQRELSYHLLRVIVGRVWRVFHFFFTR